MIYTSYYGKMRALQRNGIEPVSVSRGKPKGWQGRCLDCLAPTWEMLRMDWDRYWPRYESIIQAVNPHEVVKFLGEHDVALLCWEADINECHRKRIGEWLREHGYECEEFDEQRHIERERGWAEQSLF